MLNETGAVQEEALLTISEVAARLRVPVSWAYRHAAEIGVIRVGKYLRFDWDRVRAGLDAAQQQGKPGQQPDDPFQGQ